MPFFTFFRGEGVIKYWMFEVFIGNQWFNVTSRHVKEARCICVCVCVYKCWAVLENYAPLVCRQIIIFVESRGQINNGCNVWPLFLSRSSGSERAISTCKKKTKKMFTNHRLLGIKYLNYILMSVYACVICKISEFPLFFKRNKGMLKTSLIMYFLWSRWKKGGNHWGCSFSKSAGILFIFPPVPLVFLIFGLSRGSFLLPPSKSHVVLISSHEASGFQSIFPFFFAFLEFHCLRAPFATKAVSPLRRSYAHTVNVTGAAAKKMRPSESLQFPHTGAPDAATSDCPTHTTCALPLNYIVTSLTNEIISTFCFPSTVRLTRPINCV